MSTEEHRQQSPRNLGFEIVTVSDTRTRSTDESGTQIRRLIVEAGHRVEGSAIVPDEIAAIQETVRGMLRARGTDVIVLTGGTGFSPRDRTVEAVAPLFDRPIEGFGELFRMLSFEQVGAAAMLSRACAGVVKEKAVYALPGSTKAVTLAMTRLVLPEVGHLLGQLRRR